MKVVLTLREMEIVKLIMSDNTTQEIANILSLSVATIETHRRNIYKKLDVQSVIGLLKKVHELKIIEF